MQSMQSVVHVHRVHMGIQLSRDQRRRVRRKVSYMKVFTGYEAGENFLFEDRDICYKCCVFGQGSRPGCPSFSYGVIY